ncbi:major pollen allergen Ole e 10 [Capsicum annuum]|uniref:major pollen allergen Ole e 10 n=1 Tax=Capsicum annuum TaxID=4072 RepID=UPI0007BF5DBD|nr:major pollen allergen Ole e 10 [Capsicum annuum]
MELSNKKITSPFFSFLFISSLLIQCFPYVSSQGDKKFCVPKPEAKDEKLQACIKWVCKEGGVDCGPINAGGACFQPNTVRSRAAWAMNAYFQMKGKADAMCGFSGAGVVSSTDPSYGTCKYPS